MSSAHGAFGFASFSFGVFLTGCCLNSLEGVFFRLGLFCNRIVGLGGIIFGNGLGFLDEGVAVGVRHLVGAGGIGLDGLIEVGRLAAVRHPGL